MSRRRPSLLGPLAIPSESSLADLYAKWVSKFYPESSFRALIGDYRRMAVS